MAESSCMILDNHEDHLDDLTVFSPWLMKIAGKWLKLLFLCPVTET